MIEIWQECAKFKTTSQKIADQVRTIIEKGWFFDPEILEILQKTHKQNYNTVPDTLSGVKPKQSDEKELPTSKNENTHFQTIHYQASGKKHYHKNKR